jgi:hypothetical protein
MGVATFSLGTDVGSARVGIGVGFTGLGGVADIGVAVAGGTVGMAAGAGGAAGGTAEHAVSSTTPTTPIRTCSGLVNLLHSQQVVLDYGVLTSTRQERQLEPRYRRILSFGDVLDESIGLFRRHWLVYALVSAACLLPAGLIEVLITLSGALDMRQMVSQIAIGETPDLSSLSGIIATLLLIYLVSVLFFLAWAAAVVLTTDEYLHAVEPSVAEVLKNMLRRYPRALLSGVVYTLGMTLVFAAGGALFFVSVLLFPIFLLGGLGALIGVILWWVRPRMRSPWLKWLIILATPLGLPLYIGGVWSMWLPAAVLERPGIVGALARSRDLVDRHWFRVIGVLLVAGAIVSVLQYIPTLLVQLPLTILAFMRGDLALAPAETAISAAASIMTQILFASMATICYAVLFVDLRNRREGTDIAERLSQLELVGQPPADE